MILDGNSKVGEGKVYQTKREMELEAENEKLKAALRITLEIYAENPYDEEDENFIKECRELVR